MRHINKMDIIKKRIRESIAVKQNILENDKMILSIKSAADIMSASLKKGGKILLCGNGGSASDALHITGELVGRFQNDRKGKAAIALNADVATITAISNDFGYDKVFERSVEGIMKKDDVLICISTSGNSENVYRAALKAKEIGGNVVGLLGNNGGRIKDVSDIPIIVECNCTARIQEVHILIGHILCELLD